MLSHSWPDQEAFSKENLLFGQILGSGLNREIFKSNQL